MPAGAVFAGLLLVFGPLVFARIYLLYKNRTDWTTISDIYRLNPDAEIISFETKLSHDLAFRTTVTFDDGFTFYSHDTKRDVATSFGATPTSYELTVTAEMKEQMLYKAIIAHAKAVEKKQELLYIDTLSYKDTFVYRWNKFWNEFKKFLSAYKKENGTIGIIVIVSFMVLGLGLIVLAVFS